MVPSVSNWAPMTDMLEIGARLLTEVKMSYDIFQIFPRILSTCFNTCIGVDVNYRGVLTSMHIYSNFVTYLQHYTRINALYRRLGSVLTCISMV